MTAFARATSVRPTATPGLFTVDLDAGWVVGERPNGGYLLAVLIRAALLGSPHPHPVAVSAHFLSPPAIGSATVRVVALREGRSTATYRVTLEQGGSGVLEATVTAGVLELGSSASWARPGWGPVELPAREDCTPVSSDVPGGPLPLFDQVELRIDPECLGFAAGRPRGRGEIRSWWRLRSDEAADPLALLVAVDSLPPAIWDVRAPGWAPTVELTVHVRAVPQPGWLRVRTYTTTVQDGWNDEVADVWDSGGRLVAQSRQLARVPR